MNRHDGRRRMVAVAVILGGALTASACGGDDPAPVSDSVAETSAANTTDAAADATADAATPPTTTVPTTPSSAPSTDTGTDPFPVTIEHKYGETTITERPERIVVVGLTEQDPLLALGVVPVATTEWFGGFPGSIWPWAQDELEALGAEPPASLGDSAAYNFEAAAAQRPDLILGVYSGLTEEDYEKFSAIAPTVAQPGAYVDYGVPWDEELLIVGTAIGERPAAEELVASVQARFDQARTDNPDFDGASAAMATPYEGIFVYGPEDPRGRFLTSLGFVLPDGLDEIAGDEFGGQLSVERIDLLDLDALVWLDVPADGDDPLRTVYEALAVHTEGRDVFLSSSEPLGGATSFVTVLSLPFLIDELVPRLAAAVDGDPSTSTG